jgi:pyridoxal phosphate enzyme (YggS family)
MSVDDVVRNLESVRRRMAGAAQASGRSATDVQLVAVSKTKPVPLIRTAYEAGQRDFGENYVQELLSKAASLSDLPDLRWHMIGHLQRNKVRHVVRAASLVHTIDSVRLAEELGRHARENPVASERSWFLDEARLVVLVEVNVGGEAQKSGCAPAELSTVLKAIEDEPALRLAGLMTLPPHTEDPEGARPYFDELVRLRQRNGGRARLPELSMGMTHDLEQAVAAGATIVRVGTAIFGERGV